MKLVAAIVASLALAACSGLPGLSDVKRPAKTSKQPPHCVALFIQALTSTRVVNGAWACQAVALRARAQAAGINNDADLAALASQPPVFSNPRYEGPMPDGHGYEYLITVDGTSHPLFVWVDQSGQHPLSFQYVP